jgi:hypothetical protein
MLQKEELPACNAREIAPVELLVGDNPTVVLPTVKVVVGIEDTLNVGVA